MSTYLQTLCKIFPVIQNATGHEYLIAISDLEKFIFYSASKHLDFKLKHNEPVKPGSGTARALETDQKVVADITDTTLYGVPYTVTSIPIRDEGKLVGCLTAIRPVEKENQMRDMAERLSTAMEQMKHTMDTIYSMSEQVSTSTERINESARVSNDSVKRTTEIVSTISQLSNQTKILGLNANIEAARAGEAGRGFVVVAKEIQRLADDSGTSTRRINGFIGELEKNVQNINNEIGELSSFSKETTSTIQQMTDMVNELKMMSTHLYELAKID
ncbi:methyl-accepting chemotaxis protein [Aneurinibacillus uraniidurans]|uniref:methyl-accepting chemotaxis protein n=1 Tax=Aneurinibacillus uraniidurans TaxID=2966586 RepID=UPI00234951E3|nr:methyl-accepting chemotaxis protein [Aneurinibacillus sp. B1]WCN37955.1 methyl-accepting chemotaxis protein [Aneurinibacillus sp. B1]